MTFTWPITSRTSPNGGITSPKENTTKVQKNIFRSYIYFNNINLFCMHKIHLLNFPQICKEKYFIKHNFDTLNYISFFLISLEIQHNSLQFVFFLHVETHKSQGIDEF